MSLKSLVALLLGLLLGLALPALAAAQGLTAPPPVPAPDPENTLLLDLSSGGRVTIQLRPDVAPKHVERIKLLARRGFYNGLTFWKAEDWVVQGGDPRGDGRGGPGYTLPEETTVTPWAAGAVGMARVPGGPVNGSQFFIQKGQWPSPGPTTAYNRFGTVIDMTNVTAIQVTDRITSITIKVS